MSKKVYYRDLDLGFGRHPISNDVTQRVDIEAVKRSLRNLLSFKRNEKPFHPEISSGIYDVLFEPFSPLYVNKMQDTIRLLILKYESRVNLGDVVVTPNYDGNALTITIVFSVANQQTPINFSFDLVRNR